MRHDPEELRREILDAYERVRPDGPFVGAAPGVQVEVDLHGGVVGLSFDRAVYQRTPSDELGAAIVSAHRNARETAVAAERQVVLDTMAACGLDGAERSP